MQIHGIDKGSLQVTPEAGRAALRQQAPKEAGPAGDGSDRIQISLAARDLAERFANQGLSAERIGQLRQQIEAGVYPEPQILEELAWRLIEAGVV